MKAHHPLTAAFLALLSLAVASRAAVFSYGGAGDWSVSANWGGARPGATDIAVIDSGSAVTFTDGDAYSVAEFAMGSNTLASTATLSISGGTLAAGTSYVGRSSNLAHAVFSLSGGSLTMNSGAVLNIGNNTYSPNTFVGNTAVATISGGAFHGSLAIGNAASINQTGSLTIQDDLASVSGGGSERLLINATGTLHFILGLSGVSPLNYGASAGTGAVSFASGAALTVDASVFTAYASTRIVPLIVYHGTSSLSGFSNLSLSVTGIQLGYAAAIVNDPANHVIELKITPISMATFNVRDYGAIPNDGLSDTAALQAALNAAVASGGNCKVVFEAGTYDLGMPSALDPRGRQVLILDGKTTAHDIVLEGNGASINVADPSTAFLGLYNCSRVVMRNFTVDHAAPPFSVGTVQAVHPSLNAIDVTVDASGSSLSLPCFTEADQRWGYVLDPAVPGRLHEPTAATPKGYQNVYYTQSIKALGGASFQIAFTGASSSTGIQVGDRYVQLARRSGGCQIISGNCQNLTYSSITVYSSASAHFGGRLSDGVSLIDCHAAIKPGRWKSGDADGANFGNARVGPRIEKCSFEGMSDDGLNIFMTPDYIVEAIDSRHLRLSATPTSSTVLATTIPTSYQVRAGDPLVFLNPGTGVILKRANVVSYDASTGVVEVDGDLAGLDPGTLVSSTQVYDMALNNDGFIVRSNAYSNSRRFGNLIRGTNGLIEGNSYVGLSGSALALFAEPGRPEGLMCQNVVIRNNTIDDCGFDIGYLGSALSAPIMIYAENISPTSAPGADFHSGLTLTGNTVNGWHSVGNGGLPLPAIMASNITGGLIQDNTIGDPLDVDGGSRIVTANISGVQVNP